MRKYAYISLLSALLVTSLPAMAMIEPGYTPGPRVGTSWYGYVGKSEQSADLKFIKGMRPHHAGALTMSEQYLRDPKARNEALKKLARGIIHNQTFEIGMLDMVQSYIKPAVGEKPEIRQIAIKDWGQIQKFIRQPAPSRLAQSTRHQEVSTRDVQFAKAMIVHHQAALDMSHDYLKNPSARNGYLELMCLDIITDQSQEISLMNAIIRNYPGNPDKVKIDASMVHGMEGMHHGMNHDGPHGNHQNTHKKKHEHKEEPKLIESPAKSMPENEETHEHHQEREETEVPDKEESDAIKADKPSMMERIKKKLKSGSDGSPDKI